MFKRYIYIKKKGFVRTKTGKTVVERQKKKHSYLLRAMLCIKLMVRVHCSDRTPQMSSQNYFYYYSEICYLFFHCMVFISMYTLLFCLLFVCGTSCCFFFLVYIFTLSPRISLDICAFYRMR